MWAPTLFHDFQISSWLQDLTSLKYKMLPVCYIIFQWSSMGLNLGTKSTAPSIFTKLVSQQPVCDRMGVWLVMPNLSQLPWSIVLPSSQRHSRNTTVSCLFANLIFSLWAQRPERPACWLSSHQPFIDHRVSSFISGFFSTNGLIIKQDFSSRSYWSMKKQPLLSLQINPHFLEGLFILKQCSVWSGGKKHLKAQTGRGGTGGKALHLIGQLFFVFLFALWGFFPPQFCP